MTTLECSGIKYAYDKKNAVLKGVNANFETGKMYAILGPSGCGKTTLLSLIGGLDEPSGGEIKLNGENISEHSRSAQRERALPQEMRYRGYTLCGFGTGSGCGIRNQKGCSASD